MGVKILPLHIHRYIYQSFTPWWCADALQLASLLYGHICDVCRRRVNLPRSRLTSLPSQQIAQLTAHKNPGSDVACEVCDGRMTSCE